ncbi:MAG: hypothetical protein C0485_17550 [Pirellula sp.]|nr:hypothetical protein [Pirellula sp.]
MSIERTACRAAADIERYLASRDAPAAGIPTEGWKQVARLGQRLRQTSRWPAAHEAVQRQLSRELAELRRALDRWEAEWTVPYRASWRDIVDDLLALAHSETSFVIGLKGRTLALSTEPVELDGVELGSFEIVLHWERWREGATAYQVRALEPHLAGSDSSVTHPHVRDEILCEGEGHQAIRRALGSGRIADFFTLVARVLDAYNPDSAFARLDEWEGSSCADCGATGDADGATCRCGSQLCEGCVSGCLACGEILCSDCGAPCAVCRDRHCTSCLKRSEQGHECCLSCLDAEEEEPPADGAPSDAVRLGQTPLSA